MWKIYWNQKIERKPVPPPPPPDYALSRFYIKELFFLIRNHPFPLTVSDLKGQAHPKDISILASAIEVQARFLLTFNIKHYNPSPQMRLEIIKPGELLKKIRGTLRLIWYRYSAWRQDLRFISCFQPDIHFWFKVVTFFLLKLLLLPISTTRYDRTIAGRTISLTSAFPSFCF